MAVEAKARDIEEVWVGLGKMTSRDLILKIISVEDAEPKTLGDALPICLAVVTKEGRVLSIDKANGG